MLPRAVAGPNREAARESVRKELCSYGADHAFSRKMTSRILQKSVNRRPLSLCTTSPMLFLSLAMARFHGHLAFDCLQNHSRAQSCHGQFGRRSLLGHGNLLKLRGAGYGVRRSGKTVPTRIALADGQPLGIAGPWSSTRYRRRKVPVLLFSYIRNWVDAHTNLPPGQGGSRKRMWLQVEQPNGFASTLH